MEEELSALDERLGGATAERAALIQRLEAQARVKEKFERVEKMFSSDEARVFRQGDTVILRLVGLNFDSGASQIRPQNFDLLAKVEKAIDVFPRSELIIEGHTDSTGPHNYNMDLSMRRAQSVANRSTGEEVLAVRMHIMGYGPDQPIESNATAAGRQANRRVDLHGSAGRPGVEVGGGVGRDHHIDTAALGLEGAGGCAREARAHRPPLGSGQDRTANRRELDGAIQGLRRHRAVDVAHLDGTVGGPCLHVSRDPGDLDRPP